MLEFGKRLKELRLGEKLKQSDMAAFLEITSRHYQEMEYGKVNIPATTLISLAKYFNVSTDYLLGLSEKKNEKALNHPVHELIKKRF